MVHLCVLLMCGWAYDLIVKFQTLYAESKNLFTDEKTCHLLTDLVVLTVKCRGNS